MDLQQRITIYRQELDEKPSSRTFAPLADLLRQDGRLNEALDLVEKGLAIHPDYISALVIRGRILLDSGRAEEAQRAFADVLARDSENVLVLKLLSDAARQRQAWNEAIPLLEKLAVLDSNEQIWLEALQDVRMRLRQDTGEPEPHGEDGDNLGFATMTLVDILLAQGYRDKAVAALEDMARREPDNRDIQLKLAELRPGIAKPLGAPGMGVPPVPDPGSAPKADGASGDPLAERRRRLSENRSRDKQKFEDWLSKIRHDGGTGT